ARTGREGSTPVRHPGHPGSEPDPARPATRAEAGARRAVHLRHQALRERDGMNPRITRPRAAIAGGAAFVLPAAVAVSLTLGHGTKAAGPAKKPINARLASSSCPGPAGAAYTATAGYQAFDAVD